MKKQRESPTARSPRQRARVGREVKFANRLACFESPFRHNVLWSAIGPHSDVHKP